MCCCLALQPFQALASQLHRFFLARHLVRRERDANLAFISTLHRDKCKSTKPLTSAPKRRDHVLCRTWQCLVTGWKFGSTSSGSWQSSLHHAAAPAVPGRGLGSQPARSGSIISGVGCAAHGLLLSSGSAYYDNVRPLAYPDSDAVLICFDISRPETLDSVLKKVSAQRASTW